MKPLSRVTPATLDVLAVIHHANEPVWGLVIIKQSGRAAGTIYPILERLERTGWLTSAWEDGSERVGPRRRYYMFTDAGAGAARGVLAAHAPAVLRAVAAL